MYPLLTNSLKTFMRVLGDYLNIHVLWELQTFLKDEYIECGTTLLNYYISKDALINLLSGFLFPDKAILKIVDQRNQRTVSKEDKNLIWGLCIMTPRHAHFVEETLLHETIKQPLLDLLFEYGASSIILNGLDNDIAKSIKDNDLDHLSFDGLLPISDRVKTAFRNSFTLEGKKIVLDYWLNQESLLKGL